MEISICVQPMTVNQCWQGRRYRSKKYDAYEKEVLYSLPRHATIQGDVMIEYLFGTPYALQSDVDNFIKPITDILVKKRYLKDDTQVQEVRARKEKAKTPFIKIRITKL